MAGSKRNIWKTKEVSLLIYFWGENYSSFLKGKRNRLIYEQITADLKSAGHNRTWQEVKTKIKNLRGEYRVERQGMSKTGSSSKWPFYDEVHGIIGTSPTSDNSLLYESFIGSQRTGSPVLEELPRVSIICDEANEVASSQDISHEAETSSQEYEDPFRNLTAEAVPLSSKENTSSYILKWEKEKRRKRNENDFIEDLLEEVKKSSKRNEKIHQQIVDLMKEQNRLLRLLIEK